MFILSKAMFTQLVITMELLAFLALTLAQLSRRRDEGGGDVIVRDVSIHVPGADVDPFVKETEREAQVGMWR